MPRSRNLGNPVGAEMEGKEDLTGGKRVVRKEEKQWMNQESNHPSANFPSQ